jgi:DNA-directed RNA polymerase specialized sigma24 family protein
VLLTSDRAGERKQIESGLQADCASFEQFVQAHETAVFTFCYRMLGDMAVAECAAAAVFQQVYPHFPVVSLLDVLAAAHRRCLALWQASRVYEGKTEVDATQALFNNLPLPEREALALRYGCKLNFDEIAHVLETSCEAVRATLRQGRWRIAGLEQTRLSTPN